MSEEIKKDLSDAEVTEEVLEEETLKETSSGEDVMEGETTEESSEEGTSEEVEGQETADAESGAPLSRADKKAAKKKLKADKKQDALKEKIDELEDRVKRQMAEFENFRKRTDKEKSQMYAMGAKGIIEKILPVIDNFERGLAAVPQDQMEDPFAEGMTKIYKQMMTILEELGVKPIAAVGEEFNPDFHNAVMHIEDETLGENIIAEELQKGYMYHDSVVRHSMVKVAN